MVGGQLSTSQIIEQARAAGALAPKQKEKNIPAKSSGQSGEKTPAPANKRPLATVDLTTQEERFVIPRLVNSAIFQKKDRPDFLLEDDVINSLPTATVANVVAQHKMTQALEKQNNLREDKATKSKGGLKADQEVKVIKINEGEDNANNKLHELRFMLRTPLLEPSSYWDMYPVKWPEVNKRVHLSHLGLDSVISAKTIEMIHDRSDPTINIKMFSNVNVMMGREGVGQMSRLHQVGGVLELESTDKWLEVATVSQLEEALDNLCRVWTAMWPGEYGPSNLRGVISKHRAFATTFENVATRKKLLEDFINRILADNAVRAGQKLPPLSFHEVDLRAKDLIERKNEYHSKDNKVIEKNNPTPKRNQDRTKDKKSDFRILMESMKRSRDGKQVCAWYNLPEGCQRSKCDMKHVCAKIPNGKSEPCMEKHKMKDCKK